MDTLPTTLRGSPPLPLAREAVINRSSVSLTERVAARARPRNQVRLSVSSVTEIACLLIR